MAAQIQFLLQSNTQPVRLKNPELFTTALNTSGHGPDRVKFFFRSDDVLCIEQSICRNDRSRSVTSSRCIVKFGELSRDLMNMPCRAAAFCTVNSPLIVSVVLLSDFSALKSIILFSFIAGAGLCACPIWGNHRVLPLPHKFLYDVYQFLRCKWFNYPSACARRPAFLFPGILGFGCQHDYRGESAGR